MEGGRGAFCVGLGGRERGTQVDPSDVGRLKRWRVDSYSQKHPVSIAVKQWYVRKWTDERTDETEGSARVKEEPVDAPALLTYCQA